jgi:hypothetical protein
MQNDFMNPVMQERVRIVTVHHPLKNSNSSPAPWEDE